MSASRGLFVVLEGIDGCGNTTQIWQTSSFLFSTNKFIDVLCTREPTRNTIEIRKRMKDSQSPLQDCEWYTKMFVQDRTVHIKEIIQPAIDKGIVVLCDRFKYSTFAYQYTQKKMSGPFNQGELDEYFKHLETMHENMLVPDLVIYLKTSSDVTVTRRTEEEIFDRDHDFQYILSQTYDNIMDYFQKKEKNVLIIDADQDIETIQMQIKTAIRGLLG